MTLFKVILRASRDYLKNSSINGLSHAARAKTTTKMFYWLILVAIGGILTSYSIYDIIQEFQSYPVTTSTEREKNSAITFPAVTVCNLNRIHCHRTYDHLEDLKQQLLNAKKEDKESLSMDVNILKQIMTITGCLETICDTFYNDHETFKKNAQSKQYISLGVYCKTTEKYDCIRIMTLHEKESSWEKHKIIRAIIKQKCNVKRICYFHPPLMKKRICKLKLKKRVKAKAKKTRGPMRATHLKEKFKVNEIDPNFKKEDSFNELYYQLSNATRIKIGHPIASVRSKNWNLILGFIINCSFKGNSCIGTKFWHVVNIPCCGNCFTFNTPLNKKNKNVAKTVSFTGIMQGLSLEMYLSQKDYMKKGLSRKAGAIVVVHDGSILPQIEEFGYQIQPSTATSMSIEKKEYNLMPHPYQTDCINHWNETTLDGIIMIEDGIKYSLETCQKMCFQLQLIRRCKCQHVSLYTSLLNDSILIDGTPRTCSSIPTLTNKDFRCQQVVLREHDQGLWQCGCKNPCRSASYKVSMATSSWPSDLYLPIILEKTGQKPIKDYVDGLFRKRDFARLDVYFESLNVEIITATPKFTVDSYFAALGGALSFYLGIAIIMMFEALELFFDVLLTCMIEFGQIRKSNRK